MFERAVVFLKKVIAWFRRGHLDEVQCTLVEPAQENGSFYSWLVSMEGRRETDQEYILALAEVILGKVLSGEITREALGKMLVSDNPYREMRLSTMVDGELQAVLSKHYEDQLKELDGGAPKTAAEVPAEEQGSHFAELVTRSLAFLQEAFQRTKDQDPNVLQKQLARHRQYLADKKRLEQMSKAALANAPEFLESLGRPDHFESEKQQAVRESKVVHKEQEKLRSRLLQDMPNVGTRREKTPKELAQEKLNAMKKMKDGQGGVSSST